MRKINLLLMVILAVFAVACGKSNGNGGGSGEEAEGVVVLAGEYFGIDNFFTSLRIVNLGSNTPPVEADCNGEVEVVVDEDADDMITGTGSCSLPANFISFTFVADFVSETEFEGVITLILNGQPNEVAVVGSIEDGVLTATFEGRTPIVGNLVADWDGEFEAELVDD